MAAKKGAWNEVIKKQGSNCAGETILQMSNIFEVFFLLFAKEVDKRGRDPREWEMWIHIAWRCG